MGPEQWSDLPCAGSRRGIDAARRCGVTAEYRTGQAALARQRLVCRPGSDRDVSTTGQGDCPGVEGDGSSPGRSPDGVAGPVGRECIGRPGRRICPGNAVAPRSPCEALDRAIAGRSSQGVAPRRFGHCRPGASRDRPGGAGAIGGHGKTLAGRNRVAGCQGTDAEDIRRDGFAFAVDDLVGARATRCGEPCTGDWTLRKGLAAVGHA